jgi:integrase
LSKQLWGTGNVYKRGRVWWFYYSARGKTYHKSAKTPKRAEAIKALKNAVGESSNGRVVIAPIAERVTLKQMLDALRDDYVRKGNRSKFVARSHYLLAHFGEDARAVNLTRDAIMHYVAARRATLIKRATGNKIIVNGKTVVERVEQPPSNGTINFELALLRRAFNIQVEARKLSRDHVPVMPMLEKSKPRQGFLDPAEFDALVAKLPEHLRDAARFLYASGWRKNEAMTLEWRDVDFQNGVIRLRAEHSKNKQTRVLPLADEVLEIIKRARSTRSLGCPFVFQHDGAKLPTFRKAWASACKASGLGRLVIHDLRRSAVRNLVRAGVSESVAMGFTGHKTRSIFDRYDILDKRDLEAASAKLATYVRERSQEEPKVAAQLPQRKSA